MKLNTEVQAAIDSFVTLPRPIALTVAADNNLSIYELVGPAALSHRSAVPFDGSQSDALLSAVVRGLRQVSAAAKRTYLASCRQAGMSKAQLDDVAEGANLKIPLEIRTNCIDLIEAARYLGTINFVEVPDGLPQQLWSQLSRFKIIWTKLPSESAELRSLQAWGVTNCRPGKAAGTDMSDMSERLDYKRLLKGYEQVVAA